MRIERFANRAETTLNGAVLSGDTTITVTDASVFPSEGDFRLICENELLKVTGVSGNILTCERAIENSVATGHPSGASIVLTLTEAALQTWGRDNVPLWNSGRPPYRLVDSTGAPLTSSSYSAINAATNVTITDDVDGSIVLLTTPAASAYAICLARSMPATKTLIAAIRPIIQQGGSAGFMHCFVGFRESATGKLLLCGPQFFNGASDTLVRRYDSPTSLNSTQFDEGIFAPGADAYWAKLELDGSNNLNFYVGDGSFWIKAYSEAKAAFFTTAPDQFLFGSNASGALNIINRLVAWQEG